ncbi:MAG: T9SS type A sorting domain-containing protein [Crocinitomicaceae bacterium]
MKKVLLGIFTLSLLSTQAQTITVDDSLSTGHAVQFYVVDSNAVNLDATTGAGVTWDYSSLTGYPGAATNLDTIINASDSPNASSFPLAEYNDVINGGTSIFFENYPDSVMAHGYVFSIDANEVTIKHDVDLLKTLEFPMALGNSFVDSVEGTIDVPALSINGEPQEGYATVTADGTGTLNIAGMMIPNIIRVKFVEILEATITIPFPPYTSTGTVTRTVYSYYDLDNQKLPVFLHAKIDVVATGFGGDYTAVYSAYDVVSSGINPNNNSNFISVYPNPVMNDLIINTNEIIDAISILDISGQTVLTVQPNNVNFKLDVSSLAPGTYILQAKKGESISTEKLIIK